MPSPIGYSYSSSVKLTGNFLIDSLLFGSKWMYMPINGNGITSLTYSFITPGQSVFNSIYSSNNENRNAFALTDAQKVAVQSALAGWSSVANVKFSFVNETTTNVGDLRFGGYSNMPSGTVAWAYLPDDSPRAGDVWIGPETDSPDPVKGSYDYLTFAHEIGHALGLKHPFSFGVSNFNTLPSFLDDVRYTIMSYNDAYSFQPTTPMMLDITAIQQIYGANTQWQTGNTTYSWAADQSIFETIWDAGGNDTIDGSNQANAVRINLNEGQFSQIGKSFLDLTTMTQFNQGLAIAFGARIENAIGSNFDDTLIGNDLDNVLDGKSGADIMEGGAGNDTYLVDNTGDVVIERGIALTEVDTVLSWINYALGANLENLTLLGSENINGFGNALNNVLIGNSGNNSLDGSTGADIMNGGAGNDTYVVDNAGDRVIELGTSATEVDTVLSSIDYALTANVENLTLLGAASISGVGNELSNTLIGNTGNNTLDGKGGADIMDGGAGNDTYLVDNIGDVVIERGTSLAEVDTILTWLNNYTLGANVENLTLLGADNLNANGNALNNTLTGNSGSNVLDGGLGADIMIGGAGNDTYIVDNVGDVVIESSRIAGEIDTVRTSIGLALGENVENLVQTGTANLYGAGNYMNNTLIGNAGNNTLDGKEGNDILDGGAGTDTLIGGAGADTFVFSAVNEMGIGANRDVITDFSSLQGDKIDLSKFDANLLNAGFNGFSFIGANDFTGAGQVRFVDHVLSGNVSGNAGADFEIQLVGVNSFSANDLVA